MLGARDPIRKNGACHLCPCMDVLNPLPCLQIKDQYSTYLRRELTAQRDRFIPDSRIHCCLFFINPTGHSLKPVCIWEPARSSFMPSHLCYLVYLEQLDITVLRKLAEVTNVVPVIAKSDSLTLEEREIFKEKVSTPARA